MVDLRGKYTNKNNKDNDMVEITLIKQTKNYSYYGVYGHYKKRKQYENIGVATVKDSVGQSDSFTIIWTDTQDSEGGEIGKYHRTTLKIEKIDGNNNVEELTQIEDLVFFQENENLKLSYGNWKRV